MSWETVDTLPGSSRGGAFRGSSEPVLAQRSAPGPLERLRIFWDSTPERPYRQHIERAALTERYLYVQRRDGTRRRASVLSLHGVRLDARHLVVGVREAPDVHLCRRPGCELEAALIDQAGAADAHDEWRATHWLGMFVGLTLALLALIGLAWADASSLSALIGASPVLFGAWCIAFVLCAGWGPSRWLVDGVGVRRSRGVVPWLTFVAPPDDVEAVKIEKKYVKPKGQSLYHSGYRVMLVLRRPLRLGTLWRVEELTLRSFDFSGPHASPHEQHLADGRAKAFARRIERMLAPRAAP